MLRSTLLFILFAFTGAVYADDFNYNSVTVGYVAAEFDDDFGGSVDGDLLGIQGSAAVGESFFVFGSFATGEVEDDLGDDVDLDQANAGFGYHMSISENVDLVTSLSYEYIEISDQGVSLDENGLGLGVGLRYAASESVEINGGINYVDYDDFFGDRTSFHADVLFNFTENLAGTVGGEWGDDVTQYTIGARYYFGE